MEISMSSLGSAESVTLHSCNTSTCCPWASGIHIRQSTCACVTTITKYMQL